MNTKAPINTLCTLLTSTMMMWGSLAQANFITNGTFDTSVPTNGTGGGWTAAGNDGAGGWRDISGNRFFIINAGGAAGSDPEISQILTGLTIGQSYDITGDFTNFYNCCGNPAALSFGIDIAPGGLLTQLSDPGAFPNWYSFGTSFVASATSQTLRFTSERNGDDTEYAIDNISVVASATIPEPTTLAIMGLGLAVLGFRKKKQA